MNGNKEIYCGIIFESETMLEVVKVIRGSAFETRMFRLMIYKNFYEKKKFISAFKSIEYYTLAFVPKSALINEISSREFSKYWKLCLKFPLNEQN